MMRVTHKKYLLIVSLTLLVSSSILITFIFPLEKTIPFDTISKGSFCQIGIHSEYIINNEKEFFELWERTFSYYTPSDIPLINFQSSTVIAVYMGGCTTGGYGIEIKKIVHTNSYITVNIKEISPSPDQVVPMVITYPYHIIITEKITQDIHFNRIYFP